MNDRSYFATKTGDNLGKALAKKIEDYYLYLVSSGLFGQLEKSYLNYYGLSKDRKFSADKVRESGAGNFAVKVNHYRNMGQHIINLVNKNKTNFEAIAINKDFSSLSQVRIAKSIVNLYFSGDREADPECFSALEFAVFLGSAEVAVTWDPDSGQEYGITGDGSTTLQGDVDISCYCPVDVIAEKRVRPSKRNWVILRDYVNRWDLAAKYPEHSEDILKFGQDKHKETDLRIDKTGNDSDDYIHIYRFFHKHSAALPGGKDVVLMGSKILREEKLDYPEIPVYNMQGTPVHKTSHGYGQTFDLLGLTEIYDKLSSMLLTNKLKFGKPTLEASADSHFDVVETQGIRFIKTPPGTQDGIRPVRLTEPDSEITNFLNLTEANMEKLSGLSSVQRGDPASNLKSGNALALVASQSYQYISTLDQNHKKLLENVATGIISRLKKNATTRRIENITGKNNQSEALTFTNKDLSEIVGIRLQVGSPLMRTLAGKVEVANNLLDKNMISTPEQYFMVLETGRTDFMYDAEQSNMLNIEQENELLTKGMQPEALIGDPHHKHIKEHLSVLHNPAMRTNPEVIEAVRQHISHHNEIWQNSDINILQISGTPPWQFSQPAPPENTNTPPGSPNTPPVPNDSPDATRALQAIKQSDDIEQIKNKMPVNPLTGLEFNPETGQ